METYFSENTPVTCPVCKTTIVKKNDSEKCYLCGSENNIDKEKIDKIRFSREICFQIEESEKLIKNRNVKIEKLTVDYKVIEGELHAENTDQYDIELSNNSSLIEAIGEKKNELKFVNKCLFLKKKLEGQKNEQKQIRNLLKGIDNELHDLESQLTGQKLSILDQIKKEAVSLIKNFDEEFTSKGLLIDPFLNSFAISQKENHGANLTTVIKNCLIFSIFFTALQRNDMNCPNLIICDNTEDKGATPETSKLFQNIVNIRSSEIKRNHQIIMTTSMPSEKLKNNFIGPSYSKDNMTLDL